MEQNSLDVYTLARQNIKDLHLQPLTHDISLIVDLGRYPVKIPRKKPQDKSHLAISHWSESLLGQMPP